MAQITDAQFRVLQVLERVGPMGRKTLYAHLYGHCRRNGSVERHLSILNRHKLIAQIGRYSWDLTDLGRRQFCGHPGHLASDPYEWTVHCNLRPGHRGMHRQVKPRDDA